MDPRELQARVKAIAQRATADHGGDAVLTAEYLEDGSVQVGLTSGPRAAEARRALEAAGFLVEDFGRALRARPSIEQLLRVADAALTDADRLAQAVSDAAEAAIELFFDYRDRHGYDERAAATQSISEIREDVRGSGHGAHPALDWYVAQRDMLQQLTGRLFRELRATAPAAASRFQSQLTEDEVLSLAAAVDRVGGC